MKNWKKIVSGIMAAAVLASTPLTVPAAGVNNSPDARPETLYGSYSGTVVEIVENENRTSYYIEKDGEVVANIIANENTYVYGEKIKTGDSIEGFYDMNMPFLMIYPPQVTAEVITVNRPEIQIVKIDRFDADMLSQDGELKLNISDETKIISPSGEKFEGELANRVLAVFYSFATFSLPPQTSPLMIVVLLEKITAAGENIALPPGTVALPEPSAALNGDILVNGEKINAPKPYVNAAGVVMVPIRAVAEKLGFTVSWDGATKGVWLNNVISFSVGRDVYTYARMAPIELGTAPELTEGCTYVPLDFFTSVMRLANAAVSEGQIVIDKE